MSQQTHAARLPNAVEALRLAGAGFKVFALHTAGDGRCSCFWGKNCSRPGKHPIEKGGFYNAKKSIPALMRNFSKWPYANIGVKTGEGLGVLDVDIGKNGYESLSDLVAKYDPLVPSWSVTTGSGGLHIYFRIHEELRNSAGKLGPGIDFRGDGGFVVAPGSNHVSNGRYNWIRGRSPEDIPLADMPEWLVELCRKKPDLRPETPPVFNIDGSLVQESADFAVVGDPARWLYRAMSNICAEIANAPEGKRNTTLLNKSIRVGCLIAGEAIPFQDAYDDLFEAALQCGLDEREARSTIHSGIKYGVARPKKIFFEEAGCRGDQFKYEIHAMPEGDPISENLIGPQNAF